MNAENIVVKIVNEHYNTDHDIQNLIYYIAGKGRNKGKESLLLCKGKGVSHKLPKAIKQMIGTQKIYKKTSGRRMYQLIVSFPNGMHNEDVIKQAAEKIADMLYGKFQVFYGIHISKENWHIHYAINAVSYNTGRKWHQSKKELEEMKKRISAAIDSII